MIRRYENFGLSKFRPSQQKEEKYGINAIIKQTENKTLIIGDSHEYFSIEKTEVAHFNNSEHINKLILKHAQNMFNFEIPAIKRRWNAFYPTDSH